MNRRLKDIIMTNWHHKEKDPSAAPMELRDKQLSLPCADSRRMRRSRKLLLLPLAAALAAAGGCSPGDLASRVSAGGFAGQPVQTAAPDAAGPSAGAAGSPSPAPSAGAAETPSPAPSAGAAESPSPAPSAGAAETPSPAPSAGAGETPSPAPSAGAAETPSPAPSTGAAVSPSPTPGRTVPESIYGQGKAAGVQDAIVLAEPSDGRQNTPAIAKGTKAVALTFDDGPDGITTPAILDILKKNNVKATFFVVGTQVKQYPDVVRRIVKEGHALGNHTYHHADLAKSGSTKILQEIAYNDTLIKRIAGFTPTLFRPPYGALSPEVKRIAQDSGRSMVLWNVDTRDWAGTSVETMRANVGRNVKPGSIILMHSFGSKLHTAELLPLIIKDLKNKGYVFVTVDQLA